MSDFILYLWLGIASVIGYGAAFFIAFLLLDDSSTPSLLRPIVYFIVWFFMGTIFSIVAALAIPILGILFLFVFLYEQLQKGRHLSFV